jgi:hypothetical protein
MGDIHPSRHPSRERKDPPGPHYECLLREYLREYIRIEMEVLNEWFKVPKIPSHTGEDTSR